MAETLGEGIENYKIAVGAEGSCALLLPSYLASAHENGRTSHTIKY